MFLGGVGEIGKNMTVLEYGSDILIIDAGLTFPSGNMPGVDLVIPDITYLVQNKKKIKGIVITHGHEDHIGALPFVLKELEVPVFGTKLTLTLIENKIKEHKLNNVSLNCIKAGSVIKFGAFTVEFINVNHSIAGAVALAITTPIGVVFHSGDFKIDYTPVSGETMDLARISEIGNKGVLLMMADSTNIEIEGTTMSEKVVKDTLDHVFADNIGRRLIIATFASNVHRVQQIIDLAVKYKRKVAFSGRSMVNIIEAASKIGELYYEKNQIVDIEKTKNFLDGEIVIISTGTQGEPMSALTRMASGEFNKVAIGTNDTVVISASVIPGNEKMIYSVINNLYKLGAEVI
ncbi:MAG: ribonuclease J, partial [Firmicutes bacterium]|nr:ribonuclease J [Candidatus Caballimonas caccae]